eukprot:Phypoly_transcript_20199.p1 GENE.Phypoly_transcript_20199~~Phypoly_transcript_20199.p1  ORF type:complete len:221 (+),score=36.33 Phypoly_transcript_20199:59-664(+)
MDLTNIPVEPNIDKPNLLYELKNEWNCYWDNSYGMPNNPEKDYIFESDLAMWDNGVVHSECHFSDIWRNADSNLQTDINELEKLKEIVQGKSLGSETEYDFYPIIVEFDETKPLEPKAVLEALGAHEQIMKTCTSNLENYFSEQEQQDDISGITEWFSSHFGKSTLLFYAGEDVCNPVVWFYLGRGKSGNLIGLFSGLVFT